MIKLSGMTTIKKLGGIPSCFGKNISQQLAKKHSEIWKDTK
jgi:hypothetical protein